MKKPWFKATVFICTENVWVKINKIKSDNPGQCNSVKKNPLSLVNARPSHSLITYQILVILTWHLQKLDTQANT